MDGEDSKEVFLPSYEKSVDSVSTTVTSCSTEDSEPTGRETWSGKFDFIFTSVGYAVGIGNIFRFPYLCYKNGGGAFLVPYLIFMMIGAIPIYFLEYSVAQFSSSSAVTIWRICPLLKGVGYGTLIVSMIYCIYINVLLTWVLYFLYCSFTSVLPWSHCNNEWNTPNCYSSVGNHLLSNTSLSNASVSNLSVATNGTKYTASEEFWRYNVLQITEGIEDMGGLRLELLVCLVLSWLLIFICLFKGIKSSGKVVYVTATFPYVVLMVFLVRAVTLPGASNGMKFYLIPKFEKLLSTEVWGEAAVQIFYSCGAGWGNLITFAGFNKFHHNIYRSALVVPVINSGSSVLAGFVTFSMLGYMAGVKNVTVDEVVAQGPGLSFVTYPEAISHLPISPMWAVLFFLMLVTISLDTQFGTFETVTSSIADDFPNLLGKKKIFLTIGFCLLGFVLNLPLIMQGGMYVLQIVDWYSGLLTPMVVATTECIAIGWVYGTKRLYKDIKMMLGYEPTFLWSILWKFVVPMLLMLMVVFNLIQLKPVSYKKYQYPSWAISFGWCMSFVSIVPILLYMPWAVYKTKGNDSVFQKLKKLCRPAPTWGARGSINDSINNTDPEDSYCKA